VQKLGQLLKKHWWIPILSSFIAGAGMIVYMLVADPIYESTMVISARPSDSKSFSLGSLAQGAGSDLLGSVAAGLGGLEDSNFGEFKGLLTSRPVAQQLWGHQDLMRQIFYKRFDRQRNTWKKPGGVGSLRRNFNAIFGVTADNKPDVDDVQNFLMRSVLITDDRKSGLTTLVVRARSKELSERLVEFVANSADSALRTASQERSSQYIQYIENKLNTVTFNNRRDALIRLLDQQESSAMISQVGVPFAAQFLSQPLTEDQPSSPRPIPFLLIALFCGILIGIGMVLAIDYLGISVPALEAGNRNAQKVNPTASAKELKKSGIIP
jgi:uncharacterized protein involved in exopolysaccharide biosynthesis